LVVTLCISQITIPKHGRDKLGHTILALYVKDEKGNIVLGQLCTTAEACGAVDDGYELEIPMSGEAMEAESLRPFSS
jgi:hypothetical protein